MNRFLSREALANVSENIKLSGLPWHYEIEKHRLVISDDQGNEIMNLRLPITVSAPDKNLQFPDQPVNYIILLVQSGSCAVGFFENGINLDHKVFRAYMVRKKRGVSQIKHLKTKGKSRAGSRVRLAETEEFFEHINKRLQEYFEDHQIDRIAMSVSKTLIPFLFDAKYQPPFTKRDERIFRIPKHIHTPIYEVLLNTDKFLQKGELIYAEEQAELAERLLKF